MQGESTHVTLLVTQTLERLGIPYAVGGSLASSVHGVMRSTLDVDIVADMHLELDYLRKWAGELKVTDLLERALKEAY